MTRPQDQNSDDAPQQPSGRYRFCGHTPLDPDEGVHPECQDPGVGGASAPRTPDDLIKMQAASARASRPEKKQQVQQNLAEDKTSVGIPREAQPLSSGG